MKVKNTNLSDLEKGKEWQVVPYTPKTTPMTASTASHYFLVIAITFTFTFTIWLLIFMFFAFLSHDTRHMALDQHHLRSPPVKVVPVPLVSKLFNTVTTDSTSYNITITTINGNEIFNLLRDSWRTWFGG